MNSADENVALPESMFMVRQPIFSRERDVWGYELVTSNAPMLSDGSQASCFADFVATFRETLSYLVGGLASHQKILVNVDDKNMCVDKTRQGDWSNCVFNLGSEVMSLPECTEFIEYIHAGGGIVALDGAAELQGRDELLKKSDFIRMCMDGKSPQDIVAMRRGFKGYEGRFLIQGVRTWLDYEGTRALGFNYFQGPFFMVPENPEGSKISVGAVAKMQLIKELGNPECEVDELADIIGADVSLSYRILKYINSASFGFRTEISSIRQAIALMGLKEVRNWAMVVVMTDLDTSQKGEELSYMALQRARFLSMLAEGQKEFPFTSSSMFVVGLFSKLDALLSHPMEEVLEDLPLEKEIRNALCGEESDYLDWLLLLGAVELGDWNTAREILATYQVDFARAATQYMKASSWAATLLPEVKK